MSTTDAPRCIVTYGNERCPNSITGKLPICGSCLTKLLEEADPRRRRALATLDSLPLGVVQRLVDDPDPHVRAQIATRSDLDAGTIARLADPDREPAPEVWRALAGTPAGAEHAWELCSTNDAMTLTILAFNAGVGVDVLDRLIDNPDPDVAKAATDAKAGLPPDARIAAEIADAKITEARPISMGAPDVVTTPEDALPPPPGSEPTAETDSAGSRWLVWGAIGAVVIGLIVGLGLFIAGRGGSDPSLTATVQPDRTTTTTSTTTSTTTTTTTTTTLPPTTLPPTTQPPVTSPPVTAPPATSPGGPIVTIPQPTNSLSQPVQIRADNGGNFCNFAKVTVTFTPSPASVVLKDAAGHTLATWSGPSGEQKTVTIPEQTPYLVALVTVTNSTSIGVGGRAIGGRC